MTIVTCQFAVVSSKEAPIYFSNIFISLLGLASALNRSENSESIISEDFDLIIDFKSISKLDL